MDPARARPAPRKSRPALYRRDVRCARTAVPSHGFRDVPLREGDLEFVTRDGLCPPARAVYTGSGIDLDYFTTTPAIRERAAGLRAELGVPENARVVLAIGRFVADKGYPEILEAAKILRAQMAEDVRFVLVAPTMTGEAGVVPDEAVTGAELERIVIRLGAQSDVRPFFALADVFVHASHREGVPRVVMEAAAMGTPIVASDIPGCREVVRHDYSALLFPPRDAAALAAGLANALGDQAAARHRAQRAMADVRAKFSQDAHSERLWERYRAGLDAAARSSARDSTS